MEPMASVQTSAVQIAGVEGEVALGKSYAGHAVEIKELEPGTWIVKVGEPVPESERWLLDPEVQATLDRALAWAAQNPPRTTDLQQLEEKLFGEPPPAVPRSSRSE